MKYKKLIGGIVGGVTIIAPILTLIADAITRDREMDEIAERVVKKMKEEGSENVPKTGSTEERS